VPPETSPTGRPQNTWLPIVLAFAVLVLSTIVVVAASLYLRDDPPAGGAPGTTISPTPSATSSATPST
jgi:hypothetical protein